MTERTINLYSDTQTRPTEAMRAAMAAAEVGDEQRLLDPTINELQERVAGLLGHDKAVFLPTGTMCNLIAIAVHTTPGESLLLEDLGHVLRSETSGAAAVNGCVIETIHGERGRFTADQLAAAHSPGSRYEPPTSLLCLEQTHNFAGGAVWPLEQYAAVAQRAHDLDMAVHTDGARLMNAVVATGASAPDWGRPVDSIWIDFTKGLGAPIGAVLAGSERFIDDAWLYKHRFGGAMRQAGIAAAGCLYALDHHVDRLADDHSNATTLAEGLRALGCEVVEPDTNIVFFGVDGLGLSSDEFCVKAGAAGVEFVAIGDRCRGVTHLDVDADDVTEALSRLSTIC
ncbi:MAG TPA: GntG family PLP-dependent aldolase [Acidimicrobiales bacterium]|nr:GntG family PLP-dependent aldolase [Acidimicrobiales bacterium]